MTFNYKDGKFLCQVIENRKRYYKEKEEKLFPFILIGLFLKLNLQSMVYLFSQSQSTILKGADDELLKPQSGYSAIIMFAP